MTEVQNEVVQGPRAWTDRLLELVERGRFDKGFMVEELATWMSEDDVRSLVTAMCWDGFEDLEVPEEEENEDTDD